jgi:hypothetical protein
MTDPYSYKVPANLQGQMQLCIQHHRSEVMRKATELCEDIFKYAAHVFSGGDPTEHPRNESWWHAPLKEYVAAINNSYRVALGKPLSPYSPLHLQAYRLFDHLTANQGEWFLSSELRKMIHNSMVTSTLQERTLRDAGWSLEKDTTGGKAQYRLVAAKA